jgi:hypothetical protein
MATPKGTTYDDKIVPSSTAAGYWRDEPDLR